MKAKIVFMTALLAAGCSQSTGENKPVPAPSPVSFPSVSPAATPVIPKDGDYQAKGVVSKVNIEVGSIELDHEDIPGVMPPMRMEFFVSDKKILEGLKEGDKVDFVLRYKHPTETIVKITKTK